jgi:hypothetical protein
MESTQKQAESVRVRLTVSPRAAELIELLGSDFVSSIIEDYGTGKRIIMDEHLMRRELSRFAISAGERAAEVISSRQMRVTMVTDERELIGKLTEQPKEV